MKDTNKQIEDIEKQRKKTENLILVINRHNKKEGWPLLIFGLIVIALAAFIFIKNTTHGLYFILGITLLLIWQKMYDKYAARHDQRASELEKELKEEEELCNK